jgi:hypothetical protein
MVADKIGDAAKRFFHALNALLPLICPAGRGLNLFTGLVPKRVGQPRP